MNNLIKTLNSTVVSLRYVVSENLRQNIQHIHDWFLFNSFDLSYSISPTTNFQIPAIDHLKKSLIEKIQRNCIIPTDKSDSILLEELNQAFKNEDLESTKSVIDFIKTFKEFGVTFSKIILKFSSDLEENKLIKILKKLLDMQQVIKVGIQQPLFVHLNYCFPWTCISYKLKRLEREKDSAHQVSKRDLAKNINKYTCVESIKESTLEIPSEVDKNVNEETGTKLLLHEKYKTFQLNPLPWIRIDGTLNRRVLDRVLGALILYMSEFPGVSFTRVAKRFSYFKPIEIHILLEYLYELELIKLFKIKKSTPSLFSNDNHISLEYSDCLDITECNIEVEPMALIKYSQFIGDKLYHKELIIQN